MICYFTGTGNSRYIAEKIAESTGETTICLNDLIRRGDTKSIPSDGRLIFVTPTYAWRIPRVVEKWIRSTAFCDGAKAWFVMDCGSEIGGADKYLRSLCADKGFAYMGAAGIVMPENYIAMFNAPDPVEAKKIIRAADPAIGAAIADIQADRPFPPTRRNLYDRAMSTLVNPLFYRVFVHAKQFRWTDRCTGCGRCVRLCPLNNISFKDGRPVWGDDCTHCMACICRCPAEAIEYGQRSVGKPRYHID